MELLPVFKCKGMAEGGNVILTFFREGGGGSESASAPMVDLLMVLVGWGGFAVPTKRGARGAVWTKSLFFLGVQNTLLM